MLVINFKKSRRMSLAIHRGDISLFFKPLIDYAVFRPIFSTVDFDEV